MSDDPLPMIELPATEMCGWIHDLRNSLHALHIGLEMLPQVRADDARFEQIWQMLVDEEQRIRARMEEFVQAYEERATS
jgi:hypothetical protein